MDERQLQEAIDGMISQRPKLVVERPREVRQGMGLFEASQARPGNFYTQTARNAVKRLDNLYVTLGKCMDHAKGAKQLMAGLVAGGPVTKEVSAESDKLNKIIGELQAMMSATEKLSDDMDGVVSKLKSGYDAQMR